MKILGRVDGIEAIEGRHMRSWHRKEPSDKRTYIIPVRNVFSSVDDEETEQRDKHYVKQPSERKKVAL